ncbi:hypothetical protein EI94DRAFT_1808881 [Lactarius quietus]|nr:hypothetical protein EI94DRAFT_1808881 [Lactarius quietus]
MDTEGTQLYSGHYNAHGRGIPDISAQAVNYYLIYQGDPVLASSTTCAASTVASIISLLNDYRISKVGNRSASSISGCTATVVMASTMLYPGTTRAAVL